MQYAITFNKSVDKKKRSMGDTLMKTNATNVDINASNYWLSHRDLFPETERSKRKVPSTTKLYTSTDMTSFGITRKSRKRSQ